jgi:hypothetical protein
MKRDALLTVRMSMYEFDWAHRVAYLRETTPSAMVREYFTMLGKMIDAHPPARRPKVAREINVVAVRPPANDRGRAKRAKKAS